MFQPTWWIEGNHGLISLESSSSSIPQKHFGEIQKSFPLWHWNIVMIYKTIESIILKKKETSL